jgi:hypothetical protein
MRRGIVGKGFLDLESGVSHRTEPLFRLALERTPEKPPNGSRRFRGKVVPLELGPEHGGECVRHIIAREGSLSGQHLVDDRSERPYVGATVNALAFRLLRAHVCGGAENHSDLRSMSRQRR